MERVYDAIVVGSGFGGGVTACRLAERGWRVCVLERGRRFGPGDFPDRPEQAPFAFWHPALNPGGMFDLRLMKDLAVLTATGVGGLPGLRERAAASPARRVRRSPLAGGDNPERAGSLLHAHRGGAAAAA